MRQTAFSFLIKLAFLRSACAFSSASRNNGISSSIDTNNLGITSVLDTHRMRNSAPLSMVMSKPFETFSDFFQNNFSERTTSSGVVNDGQKVVEQFIAFINERRDPSDLMQFFDDGIEFVDTAYYNAIDGKENLLKHFYLNNGSSSLSTLSRESLENIVIDDVASSNEEDVVKVCVIYHLEEAGENVADSTGISFYTLKNDKINRVFDVTEPSSPKPGDFGLKLLKSVSGLIGDESIVMSSETTMEGKSSVEQYFDAWNRRDMKAAASLFSEECVMRDLQYDDAFTGRDEFEKHLLRVNSCLPSSFDFVIDDLSVTPTKVGVQWHVENGGNPLAFTRGCSFYKIDEKTGLIASGFEIPEKAPPKQGVLNTISSKFEAEPVLFFPAILWAAYMYILFISDGILPGANALALEQRTWEEVRDLSLNFFLVSPLLNLPFAPVVHPMLEGVFNLLLAWAAMFAGFLSDERKNKPNLLPFGPMLVGMQFLTSGFLLPYIFTRSKEMDSQVFREDITGDIQATVSEWRPLGAFLGTLGTGSIAWGLLARPEFGDFNERYNSFIDLLSIDRVGSSFLVDLAIFAVFQGWFVDDDMQRRGVSADEMQILRSAAKFIPFFGLAAYLTFRPQLPSRKT